MSGAGDAALTGRAAGGDAARFFVVAHERGDIVAGAHERIEHRAADVSGGAGQEDPHDER